MTFQLTAHALERIRERSVSVDDLAAALAGPCRLTHRGRSVEYLDRRSGVGLVVDRASGKVITVFRRRR